MSNDRRLLVVEEEFARVLGVARREGNTLSAVLRDAWGSGRLATMTRREPLKATGAHISVIGHTTRMEMLARTDDVEVANGFVNRYLIAAVRRSKRLPSGGALDPRDRDEMGRRVGDAIREARRFQTIRRTPAAEERWRELYEEMADDDDGDLAAAATARGEAQTLRLSVAYALLDRSREITPEHLEAAAAVWSYCRASARWLFGNSIGDPVADRIAKALSTVPEGLDRTAVRDLFSRHEPSKRITSAVELLERRGMVKVTVQPTDGRPREVIVPTSSLCALSDESDGSTPEKGLGRLGRIVRTPLDECRRSRTRHITDWPGSSSPCSTRTLRPTPPPSCSTSSSASAPRWDQDRTRWPMVRSTPPASSPCSWGRRRRPVREPAAPTSLASWR